jgi:hypothetical protein
MSRSTERVSRRASQGGQATLEAAFVIPVFCLLILMLCQPAILLYDRLVMESAAAEGCRLLATRTQVGAGAHDQEKYEGYVKRRLGSIPPIECFHLHDGSCSYEIVMSGDENSSEVSVSITNKLRLLPVMGLGARLLGKCGADRVYTQQVEVTMPSRPDWANGNPEDWKGRWKQ